MKPRNVSVSIVDANGTLNVWNVSFTIPGSIERKDGIVIESARRAIEKEIAKAISNIELNGRHLEIACAIAKAEDEDAYDMADHLSGSD